MSDRLEAAVAELVDALRAALAPAAADPVERLYSIAEVAAALGIGRTAVYTELNAGRLRAIHAGRRVLVTASDLAAWIADRQADR